MIVKDITQVYFLGIGGIGMSALARWFSLQGKAVAGYDKTPSAVTDMLAHEGIMVHFQDDVQHIPSNFLDDKPNTLVVYTPAIPAGHRELNYLKQEGYQVMKRSEVLGAISQGHFTVAVAGTHGKTSTSSMIAHILKVAGKSSAGFIGGLLQNYDSNLIMEGSQDEKAIIVAEADEFDRSFLRLNPNIAVVTALDPDHLDIYKDHQSMIAAYQEFVDKLSPEDTLVMNEKLLPVLQKPGKGCRLLAYGDNSPIKAQSIKAHHDHFAFDYVSPETRIDGLKLHMPGKHNVENALAAISTALQLGVNANDIRTAIDGYKGVKRRFEILINTPELVFIDDYAHHPEEIKALLTAVRAMHQDKQVLAIFQPHLYSRTQDFYEGFAESLNLADKVILLDIYPARELPIPGVTSQMILEKIDRPKLLCTKENLLETLSKEEECAVMLTVGAGDIDRLVQPIKQLLENEKVA